MATDQSGGRPLSGGELNAALSDAMVKIHRQHLGRGPTKAQTFYRDNVVVSLMEEAMTKAEQNLVALGKRDSVLALRRDFQEAMRNDLVSRVEALTGRTVRAFMSANHLEPDLASEMFVLDGPVP